MKPARKKIIIIGSAYPLRGGLSNFNERLAEELYSMGHEVVIYTFSLQYPSLLFPGKTQYSTEAYSGKVPIRVIINSINPINWISVGLRLKKEAPDLIIIKFWIPFMAPCFGTILRIAKRNNKTHVITIIDNIIPHEKRPGDRLLVSYFIKSVDGFIAMSRKVLSEINLFDSRKPKLFNAHPIYDNFGKAIHRDEAIRQLNLNPEFRYILFFGFIREYKGLDILLEAMADNRIRNSGIKLLVAGEFYSNSKVYFEIIEKHQLQNQVIMSNDFIPDSEVYKYFSACDIVVQPYKSATQSGVTQIAYNFNKPMIITNVGGLEEFVPDGKVGYIVEPNSNDVADAILRFYTEGKENELTKNVENEKVKFSWNTWVVRLLEMEKEIDFS